MNLQRELEKIFYEVLKLQVEGKSWKRKASLRTRLQWVWKNSDITPSELCDALEVDMDELSRVLDPNYDIRRGRPKVETVDVWEENFKAKLPLFIPLKITHI